MQKSVLNWFTGIIFVVLVALVSLALIPRFAYAAESDASFDDTNASKTYVDSPGTSATIDSLDSIQDLFSKVVTQQCAQVSKVLPYDRALITQIGSQEASGHSTCCPGYACAYGDAVFDGTVNSHSYYGCGECRWTDWGGGNSSYRSINNVLREAYDQILMGKPTVIHVSASYGQHWITLIGYQDVVNPDDLTLDNFIALDPWDASELIAGTRFSLYGDGCEHVSSR